MGIKDVERRLLPLIPKVQNWLYVLIANIALSVCYMAQAEEIQWHWHAWLGHLGF
jgi:hypothetical protein